jgi:hypothetical protein
MPDTILMDLRRNASKKEGSSIQEMGSQAFYDRLDSKNRSHQGIDSRGLFFSLHSSVTTYILIRTC